MFFNEDAIEGAKKHIADNSIDLIITDPPYGIKGDMLHRHYHRKEDFVIDGYVEVPLKEYEAFTKAWISEAVRILKPGGALYIVSGYTNLRHILNALSESAFEEINHIIWKYNFGVYTSRKYVSSHYHILYCVLPGARRTFNTFARYGENERDENGGSLNYQDREDVWHINREYKPGKTKNKNELPTALIAKMIQYSSNEGDMVFDFFLGGFSTAKVARALNRMACGFEINEKAFTKGMAEYKAVEESSLLRIVPRAHTSNSYANRGMRWSEEEKERLRGRFEEYMAERVTKKKAVELLSYEFGRGRFSIMNQLDALKDR